MIAHIRGRIEDLNEDSVVIDVGGVGYRVLVPGRIIDSIGEIGDEVKLLTHLQVKEDEMVLYGFLNHDELEIFQALIAISGVGARIALSVLSTLRPDELRSAIFEGDLEKLTSVKGLGKKTASRIVLELGEKLVRRVTLPEGFNDAIEGLVALGYSRNDAEKAVKRVLDERGTNVGVEDIIKDGLKHLTSKTR
ncbi:MAG TPA: Holliday junction branch migration protein RuvA [Candidatus Syntrophoarchaeum butanivorans]|uniref:Bacterial DNA recombination protein RuvA n=1 Tax=Candidatus Syntropharchaeum butanivorans TaxID=1839936 RepID=A0A1F2P5R2_9EURY|nr:MAG: Bacterial DNA recombination protein RuvA [Candidatus Syntrophoarchaeum butanivorans]HEC56351.1 Holliday junction branch migration protein RuvA [Candidatus Syntrophoarchaeum butanivorans]